MSSNNATNALPSQEIKLLGDRAQSLSKLVDHPSWQTLRDELDRVKEQYMGRLARKLVSGGISATPIDQREIDYQRGFFSGAEWILANPEQAESSFAKALERNADA